MSETSTIPPKQERNGVLEFFYGWAAGISQVIVGQPFDTIKVRAQASTGTTSGSAILKDLITNEGPLALYKGAAGPFLGMGLLVSVQFGGMSFMKEQIMNISKIKNEKDLSMLQCSLAGLFGGLCGGFVVQPLEHIRIKMQMQKGPKADWKYKSTQHCFATIFKEHGIRGIYQGFGLQQVRESGNFFYFGNYEFLKRYFDADNQPESKKKLIYLFAGGMSGMVYWVSSYPVDVIKSRIQADSCVKSQRLYASAYHCFQEIIKQDGYKGLTRGFLPCFLRSFPTNAASFYTYELVKSLFEGKKHH